MITKEYLQELKQKNLRELYKLLRNNEDSREILFILENLGHLPEGFDESTIKSFAHHSNDKIRFWAIKNLGKASNPELLDLLVEIARTDADSMVRREAVSSIGRMRLPEGQKFLEEKCVERMKPDLSRRTLFGERATRFLTLSEFVALRKGNSDVNDHYY
jgi:hypothetical protein